MPDRGRHLISYILARVRIVVGPAILGVIIVETEVSMVAVGFLLTGFGTPFTRGS